MGMIAEFNWYIVLKDKNLTEPEDTIVFRERELDSNKCYNFMKKDYRVYPMDTPLPLIYNGICVGMAVVTNLSWKRNMTYITVQPILTFGKDDPTAKFYESSFDNYRQTQEQIDDGGKVDLRSVANLETRKRF